MPRLLRLEAVDPEEEDVFVAVADVLALPDANAPETDAADEIVVLLGRNPAPPQQTDAPPLPDTLVKGRAAVERAAAAGVEMPICEGLSRIMNGQSSVDDIVASLFTRPFKSEN